MRPALARATGLRRRASGSAASASATLLTLATAAGAEAVYNPDDENTWTLRDDGSDLWYSAISDGLGNREDMVQATAAAQPKQIELSTGRFAFLRDSDRVISADFASAIPQPNTVLIVGRCVDVTNRRRWLDSRDMSGGRQIIGADSVGADGWAMWATNWVSTTSPAVDSNWTILQGNYNGASSELFRNGTSIATGDAGTNALGGVSASNIDSSLAVENGPIIVFPGLKTLAELSDIYDHINDADDGWPIGLAA